MRCPVCGSEHFRESYQCPAEGGEPVCADCCRACEYRGTPGSGVICRWYVTHKPRNLEAEIAKLRQAAELTKKKAETLWSRGQNAAAARMEEEWRLQWRRIREMEEERDAKGA